MVHAMLIHYTGTAIINSTGVYVVRARTRVCLVVRAYIFVFIHVCMCMRVCMDHECLFICTVLCLLFLVVFSLNGEMVIVVASC